MSERMTSKQARELQIALWKHYRHHGRHHLPWRLKPSPYRVVVSEVMLQQTQVARVEPYFRAWMKTYPSWRALARSSLRDVLLSWQGLGYNRRGKYLHEVARIVTTHHHGRLPESREELQALPGIGPYTARSIRAFAFNHLDIFLETNIRTVLFHHFYPSTIPLKTVPDSELLKVLAHYVQHDQRAQREPRAFYYALMDYGSHLKQTVGNLNRHSTAYQRQSPFQGSRRQVRAHLLRHLLHHGPLSEKKLVTEVYQDQALVRELLQELKQEGSIQQSRNSYWVL